MSEAAFSAGDIYLLCGLSLAALLGLLAAFGLGLRRSVMALLLAACLAALIPAAVRFSPMSVGFPLTLGAVAMGAFMAAFLSARRAMRRGMSAGLLLALLPAAYLAAGLVLPQMQPGIGARRDLGFELAVQVLGLPMLAGAVAGLVLGRVVGRRKPRRLS